MIIENGTGAVVDGTSASAPIIAAYLAAVNAARIENGKPVLGFVNPAIYAAAASVPGVFTDINCTGCVNNAGDSTMHCSAAATGYGTAPGWDAVTGWGTPNVTALLAALLGSVSQSRSNTPIASRTPRQSSSISLSRTGTQSVSSSNAPSVSQSGSLSSSASSSYSPLQSSLLPEPTLLLSPTRSLNSTPTVTATISASVAILTDHSSSQESSSDARASSNKANATIAGAVVGVMVGAAAIAVLVYLVARRREQHPRVIPTLSVVCIASGPDPRAGKSSPPPAVVVAPVGFPPSPAPCELNGPDRIVIPPLNPSGISPQNSGRPRVASDVADAPSTELRLPSETDPSVVREVAVPIAASEQASRALNRKGVADQPSGPLETPTRTLQPPDTSQCELLTSPQGSPPVSISPPSLASLEIEPQSPLPSAISAYERTDVLTTLDAPAQPCPPERTRMGMPARVSTASAALRVHAPPRHRRHSLSTLDAAQMQQRPEPLVAVVPSHAAQPAGAPGPLGDAARGDPEVLAVQTPRVRRHTSVGPHPALLTTEADTAAAWLRRPPRPGSSSISPPQMSAASGDPLRAPMSAVFASRGGRVSNAAGLQLAAAPVVRLQAAVGELVIDDVEERGESESSGWLPLGGGGLSVDSAQ